MVTVLPLERLKAAMANYYNIDRELGRGGMATVYLAQDAKHERLVALKVLHPDLAATLGPERFLREIKLAARLNHPHILPLHDSGEADGFLYYVMPYVEGESLRERLDRLGLKFDAIRTEFLGANALHGIAAAEPSPESEANLNEVVLRVGVRSMDRAAVERFTREIAPLALNGPPVASGLGLGRPRVEEIIAFWPALIPKSEVRPEVALWPSGS